VLEAFLVVIPQELENGHIVELGEFGVFRLTVLASEEYDPEKVGSRNIKEAKVRFKAGKLFKQVLTELRFRKA
jgi:nucleoid DNA-binding protein